MKKERGGEENCTKCPAGCMKHYLNTGFIFLRREVEHKFWVKVIATMTRYRVSLVL